MRHDDGVRSRNSRLSEPAWLCLICDMSFGELGRFGTGKPNLIYQLLTIFINISDKFNHSKNHKQVDKDSMRICKARKTMQISIRGEETLDRYRVQK